MLTDFAKHGLTEVFILLGDHGLPERSHLLIHEEQRLATPQNDALHCDKAASDKSERNKTD